MIKADGNGEFRTQTKRRAALVGGHENPAADILARRIEDRIGRLQQTNIRQRAFALAQKGFDLRR